MFFTSRADLDFKLFFSDLQIDRSCYHHNGSKQFTNKSYFENAEPKQIHPVPDNPSSAKKDPLGLAFKSCMGELAKLNKVKQETTPAVKLKGYGMMSGASSGTEDGSVVISSSSSSAAYEGDSEGSAADVEPVKVQKRMPVNKKHAEVQIQKDG